AARVEAVERGEVEGQVVAPARARAAAGVLPDVDGGGDLDLREADAALGHAVLVAGDQRAAVRSEGRDLHPRSGGGLLVLGDPADHVVDGGVHHVVVRHAAADVRNGAGGHQVRLGGDE